MSMGGRERRTALGRGTQSAGSAGSRDSGPSKSVDPEVMKDSFKEAILSKHSTIPMLQSLYMNPLPEEIGPIMCIIRVDKSGVNKFAPKFYLTLAEVNAPMLMASKIQSITTHIQIKIDSQFVSFIAKG